MTMDIEDLSQTDLQEATTKHTEGLFIKESSIGTKPGPLRNSKTKTIRLRDRNHLVVCTIELTRKKIALSPRVLNPTNKKPTLRVTVQVAGYPEPLPIPVSIQDNGTMNAVIGKWRIKVKHVRIRNVD